MTQEETQEHIEKRKEDVEEEVKTLDAKMGAIKNQMSDLKTHLYAKFGSSINLEADEDS